MAALFSSFFHVFFCLGPSGNTYSFWPNTHLQRFKAVFRENVLLLYPAGGKDCVIPIHDDKNTFPKHKEDMGGVPKMVGFPNKPMAFPSKNDHFGGVLGVRVPPFKETSTCKFERLQANLAFCRKGFKSETKPTATHPSRITIYDVAVQFAER